MRHARRVEGAWLVNDLAGRPLALDLEELLLRWRHAELGGRPRVHGRATPRVGGAAAGPHDGPLLPLLLAQARRPARRSGKVELDALLQVGRIEGVAIVRVEDVRLDRVAQERGEAQQQRRLVGIPPHLEVFCCVGCALGVRDGRAVGGAQGLRPRVQEEAAHHPRAAAGRRRAGEGDAAHRVVELEGVGKGIASSTRGQRRAGAALDVVRGERERRHRASASRQWDQLAGRADERHIGRRSCGNA